MRGKFHHPKLTKRKFAKSVVAAGSFSAFGAFGLRQAVQPAMAANLADSGWQTTNDKITTHDGSIDAVNIDPSVKISWNGVNSQSTDVQVTIAVENVGGLLSDSVEIYNKTETLSGTSGEATFDYAPKDITENLNIDKSDFEAPKDGTTKETVVDLSLTVDPNAQSLDAVTATNSFTVTVTNYTADGSAGGNSTTTVESSEEV